ncbi:MAG: DEAD/DEAH box helicase [Pseudomonadota bacterium]
MSDTIDGAEAKPTFEDLGLGPKVLQAVADAGYTHPTPIQEQAIPHVLVGGDVTGIAQTGTGKTAAFVLPMIHRLARGRARARMPRTLILAPTRELADQVAENFRKYGTHHKLTMALLIGGVSFKEQERLLNIGVDVLIATPGRLIDQFERGKILLTGVETLIIDEADRMLDMGFIDDIEKICTLLPRKRQTLLFSATFAKEIEKLAKKFQNNPMRIEVARQAQTAETITQYVVKIPTSDMKARRHTLRAIIQQCEIDSGIVFCNRKKEVDIVAKSLSVHGFNAAAIHGDLPQAYRTQTLERFRNGDLQLLIASDVAARGLDIPDVSHVFNFAPPPKDEDYVHRIGRTGRAGREGVSYTIVSPEDEKSWGYVLKLISTDVLDAEIKGLAEELEGLPKDEGRRGRSKGRDRGDRKRGRGRRRGGDRDDRRSDAPVDQPDEAVLADDTPAVSNEASGAQDIADDTPRRRRKPKPDRKRKDDDPILEPAEDGVRGFGDDVPSFLQR